MEKIECFVSVVAVLRNDATIVDSFVEEVHGILERTYANYEIVLVDDCSTDGSSDRLTGLLSRHKCLRVIQLSREMGPDISFTAGLESAIGDFVVTMNPDSDPPAEITRIVELSRAGHDIVNGVTDTTGDAGPLYRVARGGFYVLARWLLRVTLTRGATSLRVLSRQAVNALTRVRQHRRTFAMLLPDIGYASTSYPYERIARSGRRPRRRLLPDLRLAVGLLVHNSIRPLRFISVFGVLGSMLSLMYALYVVVVNLTLERVMPGWTTLSMVVSGLFFILFVILALLGEYMGRILDETTDRPLYHVQGERVSSVMISDETRTNVLDRSVAGSDEPGSADRPRSGPRDAERAVRE